MSDLGQEMESPIFISFRRGDTHDIAWRLADYLKREGHMLWYDMDFAFLQAPSVRSDAHFEDDAKRLCGMLNQLVPKRQSLDWLKKLMPRKLWP
jgi:hypothetical protein